MDLQEKKILITGAGGFVGSHLIEQLLGHNCQVHSFVRYNSRNDIGLLSSLPKHDQQNLNIIAGDLRDVDALRKAMRNIDIVFHLAALIGIPYSYVHPREVIETNVMGTLNVMTAARDIGVNKVVHTSTSEVYGTAQSVPISETHPLKGQSPYSASKIAADKIAESFHLTYDLPVVTIRPFNIYGPRQSTRAVIPTIISQVLHGNKIELGSLLPTRDFTYIDDTIRGFLLAADKDQAIGQTINIGSNKEISIIDLTNKIMKLMGKEVPIESSDNRVRPQKSEVERLLADNNLANKILNWTPQITLTDGLKQVIQWLSAQQFDPKIKEYRI